MTGLIDELSTLTKRVHEDGAIITLNYSHDMYRAEMSIPGGKEGLAYLVVVNEDLAQGLIELNRQAGKL